MCTFTEFLKTGLYLWRGNWKSGASTGQFQHYITAREGLPQIHLGKVVGQPVPSILGQCSLIRQEGREEECFLHTVSMSGWGALPDLDSGW